MLRTLSQPSAICPLELGKRLCAWPCEDRKHVGSTPPLPAGSRYGCAPAYAASTSITLMPVTAGPAVGSWAKIV